jgi:DUF1009 family protein
MKLGIIAGRGALPILLSKQAYQANCTPFIALLEGFADKEDFDAFLSSNFKLGEVKKIVEFFAQNGVKDLVFAGKIDRPKWSSLYVDSLGGKLLARIFKNKLLGDDTAMQIVAGFVEELGFKILSPLEILKNYDMSNVLTTLQPSKLDLQDIEIGIKASKIIGGLDIGQAVIVERGLILGVEGVEGTDNLIQRCGSLKKHDKPSGVLVKTLKPQQSIKLDPPTIGTDTIINLAEAGFQGLSIEKNKVIILNPEQVVSLANQLNIFISVI